jgi:hypothetical protein
MAETATEPIVTDVRQADALRRVAEREIDQAARVQREQLIGSIMRRGFLRKHALTERAEALLAAVEEEIQKSYSRSDEQLWDAFRSTAEKAYARAAKTIADRCHELGLAERYAPTLELTWPEGEEVRRTEKQVRQLPCNPRVPGAHVWRAVVGPDRVFPSAAEARRAELLRSAVRLVEASKHQAARTIDRATEEAVSLVRSGNPFSAEVRAAADLLPDPVALMPPIDIADLGRTHDTADDEGND